MQAQRLLHSKKPHAQKLSEEHLQLANSDKKTQSVLQICSIRKVSVFIIGTFELFFYFLQHLTTRVKTNLLLQMA